MNNHIEFLLDEASPSIQYRVKKEIILELTLNEAERLKNMILNDNLVREFIERQQPDGWINEDFHSGKGIETAIRVLCEKGLDCGDSAVSKMLKQLEERTDSFDDGSLSRVGKLLDDLNLGGSQLIRATVFAYAGVEDKPFITEQITRTLDVFRYVVQIKSINDIVLEYQKKLVFKPQVKWPSIYHLRLLAFTQSWRNSENYNILIKSIKRLVELSPIPSVSGLYKFQMISPGSFCMHNFNVDMKNLDARKWMMWFHRMELLSRIGVVEHIPELNAQLKYLEQISEELSEVFGKKHTHYYFTKWGTYTGLALERDWRSKKRYLCDLLFRFCLIKKYASIDYINT